MQTLAPKSKQMKSIVFCVVCGGNNSKYDLEFCLERLNSLNKENTDIETIYVELIIASNKALYARSPSFTESLKKLTNLKIKVGDYSAINATEARIYNYGLHSFLSGSSDYLVYLHETDIILDKSILEYYMWLFSTAHNPELVGAVSLSSNADAGKGFSRFAKMWYADDVKLRGTCIKKDAIKPTGPFDESFIYKVSELDFFNRMVHHAGWLTRLGKEDNTFIKFGPEDLTDIHKKFAFLSRQSKIWFARKWHFQGVWPEDFDKGNIVTCYIRKNSLFGTESAAEFAPMFTLTDTEVENLKNRFTTIFADEAIVQAVQLSPSFIKKPIGSFGKFEWIRKGVSIGNNKEILTNVACELKTWDNLLWKAKGKLP